MGVAGSGMNLGLMGEVVAWGKMAASVSWRLPRGLELGS